METYEDMREYLLNCGFECVDVDTNRNEVFQMDKFKFSVVEIKD